MNNDIYQYYQQHNQQQQCLCTRCVSWRLQEVFRTERDATSDNTNQSLAVPEKN